MFQTGLMLTEMAPVAGIALLLAHQGGWDEFLMVAAPVALIAGLLLLANRRAKAALAERLGNPDDPASPAPAEQPENARERPPGS